VVATVEQRDGRWVVTKITTPIEDGGGEVPPPPTDPPHLRGPAQGKAPPSCVPPEIARDAVDAYATFHRAFDIAAGLDGEREVASRPPQLEATAVDPQLTRAHDFLEELASKGQAVRGERDRRDPWAVAARDGDRSVIVYDCVRLGDSSIVDAESGDVIARNDTELVRLDGAEVRRVGGRWKVASWEIVERGLEECTSPASSS
jgi:hypothetical protein